MQRNPVQSSRLFCRRPALNLHKFPERPPHAAPTPHSSLPRTSPDTLPLGSTTHAVQPAPAELEQRQVQPSHRSGQVYVGQDTSWLTAGNIHTDYTRYLRLVSQSLQSVSGSRFSPRLPTPRRLYTTSSRSVVRQSTPSITVTGSGIFFTTKTGLPRTIIPNDQKTKLPDLPTLVFPHPAFLENLTVRKVERSLSTLGPSRYLPSIPIAVPTSDFRFRFRFRLVLPTVAGLLRKDLFCQTSVSAVV